MWGGAKAHLNVEAAPLENAATLSYPLTSRCRQDAVQAKLDKVARDRFSHMLTMLL